MSKWQVGKWYYLKNRAKVKVLETEAPADQPIIIMLESGSIDTRDKLGKHAYGDVDESNLTTEEVKESEYVWLNIYEVDDDVWGALYQSLRTAESNDQVIARIKIDIEEVRGRFDE